jgi:DnaJ-class molecular chaperone
MASKRPLVFVFADCGSVTIQTRSRDTTLSVELAESLLEALQRAILLTKQARPAAAGECSRCKGHGVTVDEYSLKEQTCAGCGGTGAAGDER